MAVMNWFEKLCVNSRLWDIFTFWYVKKILADVPKISGKILEIGCGKGTTTKVIAEKFRKADIVAIDYDQKQIRLAQQSTNSTGNKRIQFKRANAEALQFQRKYFDAVIEFNAFHHIVHWHKALTETSRILKSDGIFIAFDVGRWFTKTLRTLFFSEQLGHFSKQQFIDEMIKQGFEIMKEKENDFIFFVIGRKSNKEKYKETIIANVAGT